MLGSLDELRDAAAPETRLEHRQLVGGEELIGSLQRGAGNGRDFVHIVEIALELQRRD